VLSKLVMQALVLLAAMRGHGQKSRKMQSLQNRRQSRTVPEKKAKKRKSFVKNIFDF